MIAMSNDLRRKFAFSLILALLVYVALALYSDWHKLTAALDGFPWLWIPGVMLLTLTNMGGRLIRWHWYLRLLGVPITRRDSGRSFGVGMLMVMTPGKAGELLKSYMVKNLIGTPMSVTAPVVLAERLIDGAAMLLLAGTGLFAFPNVTSRSLAVVFLVAFLAVVVVSQSRPLALWFLGFGRRLPVIHRFAEHLAAFYESSYVIFRPLNILTALGIGLICWLATSTGYYLILVGLGGKPGIHTWLIAIFIFCISTVVGAAVAMPGGLGGVEGSLVALSVQLLGFSTAAAIAAALLIRFCSLWLGVAIGMVCFFVWPQLLAGMDRVRPQPVATSEV